MSDFAIQERVLKSSSFWMLQRVHYDGSDVTQATVSAVSWKLWDSFVRDGANVVGSGSLTVANVIFDTLQTDDKWPRNFITRYVGYNFAHQIPSTLIDSAGEYRLEHQFTMSDGGVFIPKYWLITAVDVLT